MTMERAEAYKTLRLDPSADGHMVDSAYWSLVRQAQLRGSQETDAGQDIDKLNEAYQTLKPGSGPPQAPPGHLAAAPLHRASTESSGEVIDRIADWVAEEGLRVRTRWAGRNPEIALIGGAAVFLFLLATISGAHFAAALLGLAVAAAGIWAPWRGDAGHASASEHHQVAHVQRAEEPTPIARRAPRSRRS
jgi:hypothetical protein